jgi:GNAT superfamily N-acetyltransferase
MEDISGNTISIRPAVPADAHAVEACVQAAYAPWVPILGRKPWPMLQNYAQVIGHASVFVAMHGEALVGVLVLEETAEGFLLDNVAVLPARKGSGIGRLLLHFAEQQARARGHNAIYLYTNVLMTANIALYVRNGYVEYERREENGFARVFMRKALAKPHV